MGQIGHRIRSFLFPNITARYLFRVAAIAISAYICFGTLLIPFFTEGASMEPTYRNGGFNFCLRTAFWFKPIERGDVVLVRFAGKEVMLLKRVMALAGDRVGFVNGTLLLNGQMVNEPYVDNSGGWNLPERTVDVGKVYVVGDNRKGSMEAQVFGQTDTHRIMGKPLW
jgi:signal peptidase I